MTNATGRAENTDHAIQTSEHALDAVFPEDKTGALVLDHLKAPVITHHHLYAGEHSKERTCLSQFKCLCDEKLAIAQVDKVGIHWKPHLSVRLVQIWPSLQHCGCPSFTAQGREVRDTQVAGARGQEAKP